MSITIEADGVSQQRVTDTDTTGLDLFGDDRTIVAVRVNGELWDLQSMLPESDRRAGHDQQPGRGSISCGIPVPTLPLRPFSRSMPRQAGHWPTYQRTVSTTTSTWHRPSRSMIFARSKGDDQDHQGAPFPRRTVSDEEARAELATEPYKLELITGELRHRSRRSRRGGRRRADDL